MSGPSAVKNRFNGIVVGERGARASIKMLANNSNQQMARSSTISDMSAQSKMRFNNKSVSMKASIDEGFTVSHSGDSGSVSVKDDHMDSKFNIGKAVCATCMALALFGANPAYAVDLGNGAKVFEGNCSACHQGGQNVIENTKTL